MGSRRATPTPGYRAKDGPEPAAAPDRAAREISVEAARELDRRCTDEYAIPPILLMENAAIGLLGEALAMLAAREGETRIVTGPGNNGGDGLALARPLHNQGRPVRVFLTHPEREPKGDPGRYRAMLDALGVACEPIDAMDGAANSTDGAPRVALVVDAVLGTGLDRAPEGAVASAIRRINRAASPETPVLACDIPSGLDATTGRVLGEEAVRADRTVTFVAPKPGFAAMDAQRHLGELVVRGIGAPRALVEALTSRIEPASDRDPA